MSLVNFFNKKRKEVLRNRLDIPSDLWQKCISCGEILYKKILKTNLKVCPKCNYHFRMNFQERINLLCDQNSFEEINSHIEPKDFLNFEDKKKYKDRLSENKLKTKINDAIVTGKATISKQNCIMGLMDFSFMGGSMGSVVGEKITRAIETAIKNKLPVIMLTVSGGARMQEGLTSLMQMAKTSAAIARLKEHKIPYIVILTDPTTGGTTASFAMLGDIHIAEPGALIGFAGPRVIEQTIKQKLPKNFQKSEYLLEHGMIDIVAERKDLKDILTNILTWCIN